MVIDLTSGGSKPAAGKAARRATPKPDEEPSGDAATAEAPETKARKPKAAKAKAESNGAEADKPAARRRSRAKAPAEPTADASGDDTPTADAAESTSRPRRRSRKRGRSAQSETTDSTDKTEAPPRARSRSKASKAAEAEAAEAKADTSEATADGERDDAHAAAAALDALFEEDAPKKPRSRRSKATETDEAARSAETETDADETDDETSTRSRRRGSRGRGASTRDSADEAGADEAGAGKPSKDKASKRRTRDSADGGDDEAGGGTRRRSRGRSKATSDDASTADSADDNAAATDEKPTRRRRAVAVVDLTGGSKPAAKTDEAADAADESDTPGRSRSRARKAEEAADDAARGRSDDDSKDADGDEDSGQSRRRSRGRSRSDDAKEDGDEASGSDGRSRRRSRQDADSDASDADGDASDSRRRSRKDADGEDDSGDARRSRGRDRAESSDDSDSGRGGRSRKKDDSDSRSDGRNGGRSSGRSGGRSQTRSTGSVPPAHELMRRGTRVLCKVTKEPISSKGSRVSTDISLAGRFLVLVPAADYIAVSKKIESSKERRRLKSLAQSLKPDDCGVIVRTVAEGRDAKSLDNDLRLLIEKWDGIKAKLVGRPKPPVTLYEDVNMVSSIIRDLFSEDFDRILIDDPKVFKNVKAYVQAVAPDMVDNVVLHNSKTPVYRSVGLEKQVEEAFSRRVNLKGGGYLFIETTEAMHVVDVNSGRAGRGKSQKENLMSVNLESAREVAKQLRLRDLGGIIVVDFIDLRHESDRRKVTDELKKAFKRDRAVTKLLPMSDFGLVQITRQRLRPSITATTTDEDGQPLDAADAAAAAGAGEIAQAPGRRYEEPEPAEATETRDESRSTQRDERRGRKRTERAAEAPLAATPAELAGRVRGWLETYRAQVDEQYRGRPIIIRVHPLLGAFLRRGFPSMLTRWRFSIRGLSYRVDEDPSIDPLAFDVRDEKSGRSLLSKYSA